MSTINNTATATVSATDINITVRCRPWTHSRLARHSVIVEPDGCILVWDYVPGNYTRCHSLTASAERRIRKAAKKIA